METWSSKLNLKAIGEQFGSPIYIFNPIQLRKNVAAYLSLVSKASNIAYPVKANPMLAVLNELAALGCSMDCASEYEVRLACLAGVPYERIIYNTPCMDIDLACYLLKQNAKIVIDSSQFLDALAKKYAAKNNEGLIFVRIHPDIQFAYQENTQYEAILAHAQNTAKFGIPVDELVYLLADCPLPIQGLHLHLGSRMDNTANFVALIHFLHQLAELLMQQTKHHITHLDIGGGLGIPFRSNQNYPSIHQLATALIPLLQKQFTYIVEPGNSLVGDTMGLLTKIVAQKKLSRKKWWIIDVGCDQLINAVALNTPHEIKTESQQILPHEGQDAIGGPLCFAGDVILHTTTLPQTSHVGDYLLIQHCGAYCFALGNHFNGRYFGGMISINEKGECIQTNQAENFYLDSVISTYLPTTYHLITLKLNDHEPLNFHLIEYAKKLSRTLLNDTEAPLEMKLSVIQGSWELIVDKEIYVHFQGSFIDKRIILIKFSAVKHNIDGYFLFYIQ